MKKNKKRAKVKMVEIARSFSYKLNIPGMYESRDFFCSAKKECKESEAEETAEVLYQFCKTSVIKDVNAFKKEQYELEHPTQHGRSNAELNDLTSEVREGVMME